MFVGRRIAAPIFWLWLPLSVTLVALAPHLALAGAWTLRAGEGDAILTVTPSTAPQAFIGTKSLSPSYNKIETGGLVEYGVTDDLTAILAPTFDDIQIGAPTNATRNSPGYTDIGARYNIAHVDDWAFSAQTTLRVPGTYSNSNPASIGYTSFEADVRGLVGYSFALAGMPAFLDFQVAQRFSAAGPPDEFHADGTLGVRFQPQFLLLAQSFSVFSEGNHLPVFSSYNYSKAGLSLVYDLSKQWSVEAGGFITYTEHNALEERGLVAGLWYRF